MDNRTEIVSVKVTSEGAKRAELSGHAWSPDTWVQCELRELLRMFGTPLSSKYVYLFFDEDRLPAVKNFDSNLF